MKAMRGAHNTSQLFSNRKTLGQMLREVFHGTYTMSFLTNIALVFGLVYIISPLDFDWLPFIGWIDDGVVGYMVFRRLQTETQRYMRAKAMQRRRGQ
jgi:uncharacterized membrane protein YkvA (DUF1232 family)